MPMTRPKRKGMGSDEGKRAEARGAATLALVHSDARKFTPSNVSQAPSVRSVDAQLSKMRACAEMLAEALRLVRTGRFEIVLTELVHRVCDLLDELDDTLIRMNPVQDSATFALIARLHRDLEEVQARRAAVRRHGFPDPAA